MNSSIERSAPSPPLLPCARAHVLIVIDHIWLRRVIVDLLMLCVRGLVVHEAGNRADAIALAHDVPGTAIVIDAGLTGEDVPRLIEEFGAAAHGVRPQLTADDAGMTIRVDRHRFEQVLVNLLANAIKCNCASGHVDLSIRRFDGPGIAPDGMARLFQPFARIVQHGRKVTGTGLGLVIARELAQATGGAIEMESAPSAGSTFTRVLRVNGRIERAPASLAHVDAR